MELTAARSHAELFELLPWYVNGTLDEEARVAVETALALSPVLRAEVAMLRQLQAAVAVEPEPRPVTAAPVGWWDGWRRAWWLTPVRLRWVVGAQTAAVAAAFLWLTLPPGPAPEAAFRTLTTPSAVDAARIHLVFEPHLTEAEMRGILRAKELVFVDGPSDSGVYLVESLTAAAPAATDLAVRLQDVAGVRLAAPVE